MSIKLRLTTFKLAKRRTKEIDALWKTADCQSFKWNKREQKKKMLENVQFAIELEKASLTTRNDYRSDHVADF